jgi:uncharacterized protein (TIGR02246 family)
MNRLQSLSLLLSCGFVIASSGLARAEDSSAESGVRKTNAAYLEAFNHRDAKALAALWTDSAEYVNPISGERAKGRDGIEKEFAKMFAEMKDCHLDVTTGSIRSITPDVAIEESTAHVTHDGGLPEDSAYTAIYVKKNGTWLLDSVRETDVPSPPSHYDKLKDLDWLVGTWTDQGGDDDGGDVRVESKFEWTKNHNFLLMTFSVSAKDRPEMEGTQVIGWDAANNKVRSWMFDSDGGFAESTWTHSKDRWSVNAASTLPDGRRASAVNTYTRVNDKTITWQSTGREVDGEIMPNIEPINLVRK